MGCGLRVVGAGGGGGLSLAHLILTTSFEGVAIILTSQMEKLRHREFTCLVGGRAGAQTQETSHQRTRMRKGGVLGRGAGRVWFRFLSYFPVGDGHTGTGQWRLGTQFSFFPSGVSSPYQLVAYTSSISQLPVCGRTPPLGDDLHTQLRPHSSFASRKVEAGKEEAHPGRLFKNQNS